MYPAAYYCSVRMNTCLSDQPDARAVDLDSTRPGSISVLYACALCVWPVQGAAIVAQKLSRHQLNLTESGFNSVVHLIRSRPKRVCHKERSSREFGPIGSSSWRHNAIHRSDVKTETQGSQTSYWFRSIPSCPIRTQTSL